MGGKGGRRGGNKKGGIMISMYNVGGVQGGLFIMEKTSSDSTTSYYADEQ